MVEGGGRGREGDEGGRKGAEGGGKGDESVGGLGNVLDVVEGWGDGR